MKLCEGHSMERRNNAIIKSKSSSMKTPKPPSDKFWSNANIQNNTDLKKRGLYVEKKPARYSISGFPGQDEREILQTPRERRRRRSPKPIRTEELNLNRQFYNATTGTQFSYQNIEVDESPKPKKKVRKILNRMFNPDAGVPETAMEKLKKRDKKKNKFVSRYLNRKEQEMKNSIVILQPRKNMIRAQSSHSNWSSDEARQRSSSSLHQQYDQDDSKYNYPPSIVDDECRTRKPEEKELYNFFVDLLQTSYSDYKLKDAIPPSNDEDSVKLEIDEHVVEKLKIKPNNYSVDLNRKEANRINQSASYSTDDYYKRKFNTTVYTRTPAKKRKPVNNQNKQPKKRRETKKERIINKIKKELETEDGHVYEVPQTMFEALKAISQRKKKVLRFDEPVLNNSKKRHKQCFRGNYDDDDDVSSPYFERKAKGVVRQSSSILSNWLGDAEFKRFDDNFDGKLSEDFDDDTYNGIDMRFNESYDAVPKVNKSMEHVHRNSVVSFKSYKEPKQVDAKEVQNIFTNKNSLDDDFFMPI